MTTPRDDHHFTAQAAWQLARGVGSAWLADGVLSMGAALVNAAAGFVLVAAMFAGVYKVMPRAYVAWRNVWTGALFTAVLFTLGKTAIGWYVGRSGAVSGFGAAGSLVVVLLWVYWSAQIFLLGAEFTWVYANLFGSRRPRTTLPAGPALGV